MSDGPQLTDGIKIKRTQITVSNRKIVLPLMRLCNVRLMLISSGHQWETHRPDYLRDFGIWTVT